MRLRTMLLSSLCWLILMAGGAAAQSVGVAAAVNQSARGTAPQQEIRTIRLGDDIIHDELVETDADGLLQILLADGTTFTVGRSSTLTIDSFVYDPDADTASLSATLGKGVFRFIGGQSSKTPGGVALDTPVGTVGIRGAIVDFDFSGNGDSSSRIDLRYGQAITLTMGNGKKIRLYEPGYSVFFDEGKPNVGKTIKDWTVAFQKLISGQLGKQGGAPAKPTDDMVVASGITQSNSAIPIPSPRPAYYGSGATGDANRQTARREAEKAEPVDDPDDSDNGDGDGDNGDDDTGDVDDGDGDTGDGDNGDGDDDGGDNGDDDTGDVDDGDGDTGGTEPTEIPVRVLTAQGGSAPDGIVGGTDETDQSATIEVEEDAAEGDAELVQGTVTLPVYQEATFTAHTLNDIASPFGTLSGTAYAGPGGFTAYLLAIDGDPTQPFYAITGTPAETASVFQGDGVRSYSLTGDPLQGISVPFMTNNPAFDFSAAAMSDLMVAETGDIADGSARAFQSWLTIDGAGTDQKSAIGVNVGALAGDGGGLKMERRGSYRTGAAETAYTQFGEAATLGNGDGDTIFGPDGENFVISDDMPGEPGHFHDTPANVSGAGADFSTIHVGNLESTDTAARTLSGTYNGFAAGMMEGATLDPSGSLTGTARGLARNTDPERVTVDFDPSFKSVGGAMTVRIDAPASEGIFSMDEDVTVSFGHGIDGNGEDGASAYIDDDTFGAAANPNPSRTTSVVIDGESYEQRHDADAGTYLVSSDSVSDLADMEFMNSVSSDYRCSDCDFLEWGWWGTQARMVEANGDPDQERRRISAHLGTWTVGDIADVADVDDLAGASGQYRGLAVGNVVEGTDSYVAAGRMDMNYDFGSRSGSLDISDFDGRNISGTLNGAGTGMATFDGSLFEASSADPTIDGSVSGAFVNDGSEIGAGVIGNFDAHEDTPGGWSATGVIAGERYTPSN